MYFWLDFYKSLTPFAFCSIFYFLFSFSITRGGCVRYYWNKCSLFFLFIFWLFVIKTTIRNEKYLLGHESTYSQLAFVLFLLFSFFSRLFVYLLHRLWMNSHYIVACCCSRCRSLVFHIKWNFIYSVCKAKQHQQQQLQYYVI